MDTAVFPETELLESVRLLFPDESSSDAADPGTLSVDLLKNAYRSRVFESHPDRALQTGQRGDDLKERFIAIESAYKYLYDYILNSKTASEVTDPPRKYSDLFETNRLVVPEKVLVTGQYLMCLGAVSLKDLLEALEWQRGQRPPFGEIAVDLSLLNLNEIRSVLKNKRPGERFGQCALRHGYLNSFQYRTILERQLSMQKPIGTFFVSKGIISEGELRTHLSELKRHNDRFSVSGLHKTQ